MVARDRWSSLHWDRHRRPITIALEPIFRKVINLHRRNLETGVNHVRPWPVLSEFGGTVLAIGHLWFAWTCTLDVHWIVPILAGVPFGMGNACVFIYASNYMARSYGIYTASALAGNMALRSIMGACLPLAGRSMYSTLGLNLASALLGIVKAIYILIPIGFYFCGHRIRKTSILIKEMERHQAPR
jgi:hypothetical protein